MASNKPASPTRPATKTFGGSFAGHNARCHVFAIEPVPNQQERTEPDPLPTPKRAKRDCLDITKINMAKTNKFM
jgi:hypothetical protein